MALSTLQLASLLVLICALSGALAQSSCRLTLSVYSNDQCTRMTARGTPFQAQENQCVTRSEGNGAAIFSVQVANCTAERYQIWAGNSCTGSPLPGSAACNVAPSNTSFYGITFGGSSSRLTSWITILSSLFN